VSSFFLYYYDYSSSLKGAILEELETHMVEPNKISISLTDLTLGRLLFDMPKVSRHLPSLQVCVQLPAAAVNVTLLAFAAERRTAAPCCWAANPLQRRAAAE